MSRTRMLFALLALLVLCAPARAESDSLISADLIKAETVNYNTETVRLGVYQRTYSAGGTEYYPYEYQLCFEIPGAKFVEYVVKRGDTVHAGDALATLSLEIDEVGLAAKRLSLARTQETFDAQKLSRLSAIDELRAQAALTDDRFEREILALRVSRQELALEQYIFEQGRSIDRLLEEIAEIEEDSAQNVLYAPADGVITSLTYLRPGDLVSTSTVLVTLYRTDGMLLRIENLNDYFRYGMAVTVDVGPAKSRVRLTGRIVGADTLLPESQRTGYAFIELDPYDAEEIRFTNPSVTAPTYYLENVLLIPRRAAVLDSGKYYVSKLVDGMVQKRYINYVVNNNTDAWILQGVSDGETIILD